MDDKKKLVVYAVLAVVAIAGAIFMFAKSGAAGEAGQEKAVGSLEDNTNKESGLPLNPPSNDPNFKDPSLQ
ncbi:MAG: hypothetical protein J0L72_09335 [Armatimonadetes bacterium]|nr:hypothetical protein [Armatimonadota bacterium]